MSAEQLTAAALALPLSAKAALARMLWESIDQDLVDPDSKELEQTLQRRAEELASSMVVGRTREEVMQAAHGALDRF